MGNDLRTDILFDRRHDHATAVEVERAVFLKKCFGIKYSGAHLFSRKISLRIAIRVLVEGNRRVKETFYMQAPRQKEWNHRPIIDLHH